MTDPRVEAVADAAERFHLQGLDRKRERNIAMSNAIDFLAMYDAARAFDQPPPESEVMPHSVPEPERPKQHNATAPIVGADPPWLDELDRCIVSANPEFRSRLARSERLRIYRVAIAFANAQLPSEVEIEMGAHAAREAWVCNPGSDWNAVARAALIAAARIRSGR